VGAMFHQAPFIPEKGQENSFVEECFLTNLFSIEMGPNFNRVKEEITEKE